MDRTGNHVLSMARLAKDVLAEIPDQFISYMKSRGIKPNPAPPPYTPPGHTHHHTQIWRPLLGFSLRTDSMQQQLRVQWEICASCFLVQTEADAAGNGCWILCRILPVTFGAAFRFFEFSVIYFFGWFLLKRGCKLSRTCWWHWQWLFHIWFESRLVEKGHVVVKTCACLWLFL